MPRNLSDQLARALDGAHLEILHVLAYQAALLHMPLYLVGGVVRDILLGRAVKDFDLVLEGDSAEFSKYIVKKFGGRVTVHSKFGTATWVLNEATYQRLHVPAMEMSAAPLSFDLITARSETYDRPGALPTVRPSTIEDDLRRRDFTINAMAIRLDADYFGDLYDPLDGGADLENRLVRVLHDRSFVDDPTRIFRAVRYAWRYGFEIAPETLHLINVEAKSILVRLSGERLRHEFDLIFEEERSAEMIQQLEALVLLSPIHPDLIAYKYRSPFVYHLTAETADFVYPDILSFEQTLAWIMWLITVPVPSIEAIAKRLAFPAVLTNSTIAAAKLHASGIPVTAETVSQKTFYLDSFPVLSIYAAWIVTQDLIFKETLNHYLTKWRHIKPYTTGYILQQRGLPPGPRYKEILSRLRAAWLDAEVNSEEGEVVLLGTLIAGT